MPAQGLLLVHGGTEADLAIAMINCTIYNNGSTKHDKTQCNSKQHICGSFPSLNNMYGSGGNSSFVIQQLIMSHFCVFQKVNLQNFSVTWNKINNSSDILISYPSITYI